MRILYLCRGNSCRSQMAEAWTRSLHGPQMEAYSAGTRAKGLDPRAMAALEEAGVSTTGLTSKTIDQLPPLVFDLVVTVCDAGAADCPVYPGARRQLHVPFDDPPELAERETDEVAKMAHYRRVRDEIRAFVAGLPALLAGA